jgi:hypothetical protein
MGSEAHFGVLLQAAIKQTVAVTAANKLIFFIFLILFKVPKYIQQVLCRPSYSRMMIRGSLFQSA